MEDIYITSRQDSAENNIFAGLAEDAKGRIVIHVDDKSFALNEGQTNELVGALIKWNSERREEWREPFTCATELYAAERTLRIIENATKQGDTISAETVEALHSLVLKAGPDLAKGSIRKDHPF
ncbi:hypothetical protein [Novosphingobium rosa]|uniref:hypothetical protein n=1 Tax=Novosphingobium rosa TaxID=76978 RepID=UPI000835DDB4|nr:hypothetical protein [Novosphingobium rosa]